MPRTMIEVHRDGQHYIPIKRCPLCFPRPHYHAGDGNCDCHYSHLTAEPVRCIGGCGKTGKPDQWGKFLCDQCERADKGNR